MGKLCAGSVSRMMSLLMDPFRAFLSDFLGRMSTAKGEVPGRKARSVWISALAHVLSAGSETISCLVLLLQAHVCSAGWSTLWGKEVGRGIPYSYDEQAGWTASKAAAVSDQPRQWSLLLLTAAILDSLSSSS